MAKKDLKPDTVLKNYWNGNDEFADLFNAVLFEGRKVILPEELEDIDTEESSILEHRDYAESIQNHRDNIKIRKKSVRLGVELVMLGLESQEHIHYAMPMRVLGYDYSAYKKQYDSNAKQYKKAFGMEEDEYLSKMKKTDRFIPIITVVVYYGEKAWDGATSLHEMLNIPEEIKKYVNDYRMLLVEARQNNLKLHNINNKDLFYLLEVILDRSIPKKEAMQKVVQYNAEHKIDKTVIMTVAGAANMTINYHAFEKGVGDMCTLFEEIAKENEAKGKIEGKIEGKSEGIIKVMKKYNASDDDIIEELMTSLEISASKAKDYLNRFSQS